MLHNNANSSMTAEVISGPRSVRMIFGILRDLMTHATMATKNSSFVNRGNGSNLHTPKKVQ